MAISGNIARLVKKLHQTINNLHFMLLRYIKNTANGLILHINEILYLYCISLLSNV